MRRAVPLLRSDYIMEPVGSLTKTAQIKSMLRWFSRDRFPAYVAWYHKVNLWVREPRNGRVAPAFLNASFDPATGLELAIAATADKARVFDMHASERVVRAGRSDGPYRHFILPPVQLWTMRRVTVGPP
jgi:hypothetical protein